MTFSLSAITPAPLTDFIFFLIEGFFLLYKLAFIFNFWREIQIVISVWKFKNSKIHKKKHHSLTDDRFKKNVIKKSGWDIVGFFSYLANPLRSKSDLLGLSSYIDLSISHVNFHLKNLAIFGFFAFIWAHFK